MSIINYSYKTPHVWYASGVIIFNSDFTKTIIVKTYRGNIGFPKGGKEYKERVHQTAYREVKEETGLLPEQYKHDSSLIGEKKGDPDKGAFTIYYFMGYVDKETESIPLQCSIPNELKFVKWVNIEDAYNMLCKRRSTILKEAYDYMIDKLNNNRLDDNLFNISNFYNNKLSRQYMKDKSKLKQKPIIHCNSNSNSNRNSNSNNSSNYNLSFKSE